MTDKLQHENDAIEQEVQELSFAVEPMRRVAAIQALLFAAGDPLS